MPRLMRCKYCGTLQDEPRGAKICVQCGGELTFEVQPAQKGKSYIKAQLELDQIAAPADQIVERHLVITLEAPDAVPVEEQVDTPSGREPLHFVAVLDTSSSMQGSKIRAAKEAVRQAMHRLVDGDIFSLVTFDTYVRCLLEAKRVDAGFRRVVESGLQEIWAEGNTALCRGLELGVLKVLAHLEKTNLVLLLSDGQANVGETDVEAVGRRAMEARSKGVTVSALGVGYDYNEAMMAEIAIEGGGRFYHIANASQIAAYLTGELGEVASLAARNAAATLNLPAGTGVQTLSAAYPVQGHTISLGDIPTATTLEVIVRVLLTPQPVGYRLPIDGALSYQSPAGNALTTQMNRVTVRYEKVSLFAPAEGVVRPIIVRVLDHMRASSVLATSKAATDSLSAARRESEVSLAMMRKYATLLGEDVEIARTLSETEGLLKEMTSPWAEASDVSKDATLTAMRLHRGSKDFDKA
jgi:Ca-activated chloride channel family protein